MKKQITVKEFRDARNWSQGRLAREIGVCHSTVHRWESDQGTPRLARLLLKQAAKDHPIGFEPPKINTKNFRQARNWSQSKLARELGVDQATVWRWENGQNVPAVAGKLLSHLASLHPLPEPEATRQGENA